MPQSNTQLLKSLIDHSDNLIERLSLEDYSAEDQLKIIERFSEIFFKRILLRIPPEHTETIKASLEAKEGSEGMEYFLETIRKCIPNIDQTIEEEFNYTLENFQQL